MQAGTPSATSPSQFRRWSAIELSLFAASVYALVCCFHALWAERYLQHGLYSLAGRELSSTYYHAFRDGLVVAAAVFFLIRKPLRSGVNSRALTAFLAAVFGIVALVNYFIASRLVSGISTSAAKFNLVARDLGVENGAAVLGVFTHIFSPVNDLGQLVSSIAGVSWLSAVLLAVQVVAIGLIVSAICRSAGKFIYRDRSVPVPSSGSNDRRALRLPPFLRRAAVLSFLIAWVPGVLADSKPETKRPNILLISIDTLRADRLGSYGYAQNTSPRIDQIAAGARVFDRAVSQSSWTLPSHASMFSGLFPVEHGCTSIPGLRLPPDVDTLAEILANSGYRTFGVASNIFVGPSYGLDQGFERYSLLWQGDSNAEMVVDEALRLTDEWDGSRPLFLFVHFMDPHHPYWPPERYRNVPSSVDPMEGKIDLAVLASGGKSVSPERLKLLSSLYDGEIRYVDEQIGRLVDALTERGVLDGDTAIVITSDHGESFGENGEILHAQSLFSQQLHVPLIVDYPPLYAPGARISAIVNGSVLVHSITLEIAGLHTGREPGNALGGAGLWESHGLVFSETATLSGPFYAVHDDGNKLIARLTSNALVPAFMYDTKSDWSDTTSLLVDGEPVPASLREGLVEYLGRMAGSEQRQPADLGPWQMEELKSLGYVQ